MAFAQSNAAVYKVTLPTTPTFKTTSKPAPKFKVNLTTPIRELTSVTYQLDTTANASQGIISLISDITSNIDSVAIVGANGTIVSSNGTAIIITTEKVDGGTF